MLLRTSLLHCCLHVSLILGCKDEANSTTAAPEKQPVIRADAPVTQKPATSFLFNRVNDNSGKEVTTEECSSAANIEPFDQEHCEVNIGNFNLSKQYKCVKGDLSFNGYRCNFTNPKGRIYAYTKYYLRPADRDISHHMFDSTGEVDTDVWGRGNPAEMFAPMSKQLGKAGTHWIEYHKTTKIYCYQNAVRVIRYDYVKDNNKGMLDPYIHGLACMHYIGA